MLRNLGIVEVYSQQPRFRANATRRIAGRSLLEMVVRRVTDAMRLNGVIVVDCDPDESGHVRCLVPSDVPVFHGKGKDVLDRFTKSLEEYPAEGVVRVRGDNLFVDPGLIDRLVTAAESQPDCDYVAYHSSDGRPAILSPVSVYAEWCRTSALRKANRLARDEADRQHATRYLYSHPEHFNIRQTPAPAAIDRDDVRLTVDIEEDWDHAIAIFEALGPELLDWQRIARLLDHQPALRSRMAVLNRAHAHV